MDKLKEIGKMFNIVNGLKEDSNFGFRHIQIHPEDIEEIIKKYNELRTERRLS